MAEATAGRRYWTARQVRVTDLREDDVVLIHNQWRELLDVWAENDDPAEQFGEDHYLTREIRRVFKAVDMYRAVRYVDPARSSGQNIASSVKGFTLCDLVTVQVPETRELIP